MTSAKENEFLTRIGPGTPMGELMREFWIPACMSSEVSADGAPMRLLLLGEKLIAFRDASGRVGILDHACPHRCASLFFGRNEGDGLRCVYHGWKFDLDGNCVETPNISPNANFNVRIKATAYKAVERNGIVYAYMGKAAVPPPLPELEALLLTPDIGFVSCNQRECNWLQAMEGNIDTSHLSFLHFGAVSPDQVDSQNLHYSAVTDRAPDYHVKDTEWGTMYCGYRPHDPDRLYYRFAHFHLPFWTQFPDGTFKDLIVAQAWVPMDDTHTMIFTVGIKKRTPGLRVLKDGSPIPGLEIDAAGAMAPTLPNTTDWHGRWKSVMNLTNDYLIDREAQRTVSFTGISSVPVQDQAIGESMGPILDRTREHLCPSDIMIARTRRRLMTAAREHAEHGTIPAYVNNPVAAHGARSGSFLADKTIGWETAYKNELTKAISPTGTLQAAE